MGRPPISVDSQRHFTTSVPSQDFAGLPETRMAARNVGWSLGNYCPYRCRHCYSASARVPGMDLELWMVDRVVEQLSQLHVETVNLGGNEPLYTSGSDPKKSLLPHIVKSLRARQIKVGLTTSGITVVWLEREQKDVLALLNDVDVSFDSPISAEHNTNRGAHIFLLATEALKVCQAYGIERSVALCAMNWNFDAKHIDGFLELARQHEANLRVNTLRPITPQHEEFALTADQFYRGFSWLLESTEQLDLGDPLLSSITGYPGAGCPCGRTSFRIHSVTPDGQMPVSPCIYVHDYKAGDLLTQDVTAILDSPQFRAFRRRHANPKHIAGCAGCRWLQTCRGGCAARAFFDRLHRTGESTLCARDPYCLAKFSEGRQDSVPSFPVIQALDEDKCLVHKDYLCTWIGKPASSCRA